MVDWTTLSMYVARAIALLTAIPFHEMAHAWASDRLGDPTAKRCGRLSMNPLRHFDPLGALCMILVGFGWAKPVPVAAVHNFRHPRRDMALSAAAGPAANLLLAYVWMICYKIVYYFGYAPESLLWQFAVGVLLTMIQVNITLAVFNLLPVPPLDGSRIFNLLLPARWYFRIMKYERYIMLGLFVFLFFGFLDRPLSFLFGKAIMLFDWGTRYIDMLYLLLHG